MSAFADVLNAITRRGGGNVGSSAEAVTACRAFLAQMQGPATDQMRGAVRAYSRCVQQGQLLPDDVATQAIVLTCQEELVIGMKRILENGSSQQRSEGSAELGLLHAARREFPDGLLVRVLAVCRDPTQVLTNILASCIQRASSHPPDELVALGTPYIRAAEALITNLPQQVGEAVALECNACCDGDFAGDRIMLVGGRLFNTIFKKSLYGKEFESTLETMYSRSNSDGNPLNRQAREEVDIGFQLARA